VVATATRRRLSLQAGPFLAAADGRRDSLLHSHPLFLWISLLTSWALGAQVRVAIDDRVDCLSNGHAGLATVTCKG
jgi:hypothetical protein